MSEQQQRESSGPPQLLGELEAAVMRVIWERGEQTVRDVWQALQPERRLAYTTVMTVMSRLATKGLLDTRKQGPAYRYRATMTEEQLRAVRAQSAVQQVLARFGDLALAEFIRELDDVDPQRLAQLRALAHRSSSLDGTNEP